MCNEISVKNKIYKNLKEIDWSPKIKLILYLKKKKKKNFVTN